MNGNVKFFSVDRYTDDGRNESIVIAEAAKQAVVSGIGRITRSANRILQIALKDIQRVQNVVFRSLEPVSNCSFDFRKF